jgi:hypothetical protein
MVGGRIACEAETEFLGAFAKFRKVTINFANVYLSVCPQAKNRFPLERFS